MTIKTLLLVSLAISVSPIASTALGAEVYPASARQTTNLAVDPGGKNWSGTWERIPSEGLAFDTKPPLRPEIAEKVRKGEAMAAAGKPPFDPTAACLPPAMPRMMGMVHPMEIVQRVGEIVVFAEWAGQVRRIYTDGRTYSEDKDLTYNGYSVGRWENGDLLVEVRGFKDKLVFDANGIVFSDKMVIHERWHEVDPDTLKYTLTVEDPTVLTRPWTASKTFKRNPEIEIGEYVCEENNRNPMTADGAQGLLLPGQH